MKGIWILLILAVSETLPTVKPVDVPAIARAFLEAFARSPTAAKTFVTKDAGIVMGDIGGPYDDYAKVIQLEAADLLKSCSVIELQEQPGPTADELKDAPPRYHGGKISVVEGKYSCGRPDGSKSDLEFTVVLKNGRIVEFALGADR